MIQMNSVQAGTVEEVREFFNWEAVAIPDTYEWQGETRETGQTKWVRSDNGFWLGTRGDSTPHGYSQWLVDNMSLLTDSELRVVNYGELNGGRQAYVQIATEQTQEVSGVEYRPMITATSSMDGSFATGYGRGIQVIICLNTFQMARAESENIGAMYKVKATKNSKFEVLAARTALNVMFEDADDFGLEIAKWTGEKVSEKRFDAFLNKWAPLPEKTGRGMTMQENKRETLFQLWTKDERVQPWRGTKFGVVQAVNTYETHFANVRGGTRQDRNMERTMRGGWAESTATVEKWLATV